MPRFFSNFEDDPRMQRQALMSKYNAARVNLIAVVVFTVINMATLGFGSGSYFLFSANLPYMLTFFGMYLCGMMPDSYYEGVEGMYIFDKSFFVITLVISILILAVFLLCWYFSRKGRVSWLKTALILFVLDTVSMFIFGSAGMLILDIAFHVWVIVTLAIGIKAHKQILALPKEEMPIEAEFTDVTDEKNEDELDRLLIDEPEVEKELTEEENTEN